MPGSQTFIGVWDANNPADGYWKPVDSTNPFPVTFAGGITLSSTVTVIQPTASLLNSTVTPAFNTTVAQSSVTGATTSTTVLALNAARQGATVYNDSSAVLYLKLGNTASTTSYTLQMAASSYYEVPYAFTGIITGLWATATGSARVTEVTV